MVSQCGADAKLAAFGIVPTPTCLVDAWGAVREDATSISNVAHWIPKSVHVFFLVIFFTSCASSYLTSS